LNEKTQKLIEEQITQQKVLLQKIEQAKSAEEKNSILTVRHFFCFFCYESLNDLVFLDD
jgi:hypothetical protein